ncbi:MAG: hypothetical protein EPN84_03480 [Legionella sp.]|nr:MAG: hypothetical protein EPN84_03480 [Legionella sp.]
MLLQIRDFIHNAGVVSTQQLTREFRVDLPALQPMLDLLMRKGFISKCNQQANCQSSCFKCRSQSIEYYQISLP